MKKKGLCFGVIAIFILILCGMYILTQYTSDPARIYEENWNIDFPNDMKEIASAKTEQSFHGDGIRYTVFSVNEMEHFADDFDAKQNLQMEQEFGEYLKSMKSKITIRPNWTHNYVWKYMEQYEDSLYLIYDKQEQKLFVLQITI